MTDEYRFAFEGSYRWPARVFGVTERSAVVTVTDTELLARFGPWTVRTPLANITAVSITGPYRFVKTAGPAHLSFADRGITFATNHSRGVFVEFQNPVGGLEPTGLLTHPNLTVTVADCDALARRLERRPGG